MSAARNIGKAAAGGGLLVAACAACCAPLVAPWLVAVLAAGGAGLALAGQVGIAVLIVAAGGAYIWSRHRRQKREKAAATSACNCSTDSGRCGTDTPSQLPIRP